MNRLVALPLILTLLIGGSLPDGHGNRDSDRVAARPHVHLSGSHDHHHGEGGHTHKDGHPHPRHEATPKASDQGVPGALTTFQRPEHHQDAIYLADFHYTGRPQDAQKKIDASEFGVGRSTANSFAASLRSQSHVDRFGRPLSLFGPLPIYLAHAALRL